MQLFRNAKDCSKNLTENKNLHTKLGVFELNKAAETTGLQHVN